LLILDKHRVSDHQIEKKNENSRKKYLNGLGKEKNLISHSYIAKMAFDSEYDLMLTDFFFFKQRSISLSSCCFYSMVIDIINSELIDVGERRKERKKIRDEEEKFLFASY
jgi:hypothetical protein